MCGAQIIRHCSRHHEHIAVLLVCYAWRVVSSASHPLRNFSGIECIKGYLLKVNTDAHANILRSPSTSMPPVPLMYRLHPQPNHLKARDQEHLSTNTAYKYSLIQNHLMNNQSVQPSPRTNDPSLRLIRQCRKHLNAQIQVRRFATRAPIHNLNIHAAIPSPCLLLPRNPYHLSTERIVIRI